MAPVTARMVPIVPSATWGIGIMRPGGAECRRRPRKAHSPMPPARPQLTASQPGVRRWPRLRPSVRRVSAPPSAAAPRKSPWPAILP